MTELGEKSWDLSLYELHRYILKPNSRLPTKLGRIAQVTLVIVSYLCPQHKKTLHQDATGGNNRHNGDSSLSQIPPVWANMSHLLGHAHFNHDHQRMPPQVAALKHWQLNQLSITNSNGNFHSRFCAECIITALRSGNKECPTCRKKLVSKRSLR